MTAILICGGGDAGQALACLLSQRHKVTVLSLQADEAERWSRYVREAGCMTCHLNDTSREVRATPDLITSDPMCVKDCNVVFFSMSSTLHDQYFTALEPYVQPGTVFSVMPARSGCDFVFRKAMGRKSETLSLAAFVTVPWACHLEQWGRTVTVLGTRETVSAAIVPPKGRSKRDVLLKLQGLLGLEPIIVHCPNVISISLGNPGQVVHPGITYARWRDWDGKPLAQRPPFYHGVDAFAAKVLEDTSSEIQKICQALRSLDRSLDTSHVKTVYEWYVSSYSACIADSSSLQQAMRTSSIHRGLCHPMLQVKGGYVPDFSFRYLSEDVPTGLCFSKGVACLLGLKTPTMDEVIRWCQDRLGKEFLTADGRMEGKDLKLTRAPQAYGVRTKRDLIAFLGLRSNSCFGGIC